MTQSMKSYDLESDFARYLEAKTTIDDRALDVGTMMALGDELSAISKPIFKVLEVGCGVGNMLARLFTRGLFEGVAELDYTAIDIEPRYIERACERIEGWAQELGYRCESLGDAQFRLLSDGQKAVVRFKASSLAEWSQKPDSHQAYDLVIAQAVLDILDANVAVGQVFRMLPPDGLYYFPIHFDGNTIFEPSFDPLFDSEIERLYHASMDNRVVDGVASGDSRTGRHLFNTIRAAGGTVRAAGGSSWVVHSQGDSYPADEAYFLHYIVDGVYQELAQTAEISQPFLWQWAGVRHSQIESGELVYIAHQLDFFGVRT